MDIEYFDKLWNSKASKDLTETKNFWDLRADEFNENSFSKRKHEDSVKLMEFLVSKNIINNESEVLDIGCGPGKYSIELAKLSKHVTGIDISSEMLKHAIANSNKIGFSNTDFKLMPWENTKLEDYNWVGKYDLVFASKCPGINSKDALIKMIKASKGYCFISGFAKRNDKVRDDIYEYIYGEKNNPKLNNTIYCGFNILWNLGYYPEITYQDVIWEADRPIEIAIEFYTHQIQRNNKEDLNIRKSVTDYLQKIAEAGKIKDTITAKIAWMYWRV